MIRFPSPLIKPDVPISGIRLSDWLHLKAHVGWHLTMDTARRYLRLKVTLLLKIPDVLWCLQAHRQSPLLVSFRSISEVRGLPSISFPRLLRYYSPLRLPPQTRPNCIVAGRYPAPGSGLPRCIQSFPDVPSSLPRWIRSGASVG